VEKYIIQLLIALMSILLIIASLQLAYEVIKAILTSDGFLIDLDGLMGLFSVFLLVLIGIELLDTIKVYFKEHVIHVEIVLLVAIIAVARKVIVMDFDKYSGIEIIGIGFIVLALAGGYYLVKKSGKIGFWPKESEEDRETIIEEKAIGEENDERLIERKKVIKSQIIETPADPEDIQSLRENQSEPKGKSGD
jgi:uncharacterized membrane protein (DUF373 family)